MAGGNFGAVYGVGYKNTDTVVKYALFVNTIYLGADSDITPKSFSGYLKEVKFYTIYHGLAQK